MAPDLLEFLPPQSSGAPLPPGLGFLFRVVDAKQAGAYLQLAPETVIVEAEAGRLPGRKIGGEWRFVPLAIAEWLLTGRPTAEPPKRDALLAVAGCFADDETLPAIVAEAYRLREQDKVGGKK